MLYNKVEEVKLLFNLIEAFKNQYLDFYFTGL